METLLIIFWIWILLVLIFSMIGIEHTFNIGYKRARKVRIIIVILLCMEVFTILIFFMNYLTVLNQ